MKEGEAMDHVLIDKEIIRDADLYSVRNELEARLAARPYRFPDLLSDLLLTAQ